MLRHAESEKLDCFTKVVTPENIEFEYALAGPFQRFPAYLTDLVIWNFCFYAILFTTIFTRGSMGLPPIGEITGFLFLIAYFFVSWFYGVYFETYYNGRTLGKMLFKLRSISIDGRPINGMQAGLRNILRLADINIVLSAQVLSEELPNVGLVPTFTIGLVAMCLTTRMQRIGDLASGTMVISERKSSTPWNLQPDDVRAYGLAELIPPTFEPSSSMAQTIGLYMENRSKIGTSRREEIAGRIAKPLIKKFEMLPNTGFDLLLCALYVKIFLSEQQQAQGLDLMRKTTVRTNHATRLSLAPTPTLAANYSTVPLDLVPDTQVTGQLSSSMLEAPPLIDASVGASPRASTGTSSQQSDSNLRIEWPKNENR